VAWIRLQARRCLLDTGQAQTGSKFDEYGNIRFNDEKARLDNFAIQLQNEPTARAHHRLRRATLSLTRANRAKDYLVNARHRCRPIDVDAAACRT
jgi:hypothetical protein